MKTEKTIEQTAQDLRDALADAFGPLIEDRRAQKFAHGLRQGISEPKIGLKTVPIDVVYRAMLNFARKCEQ